MHAWMKISVFILSQSFKKILLWQSQNLDQSKYSISEFVTKRRFILKSVRERFACGVLVAHNVTSAYVS